MRILEICHFSAGVCGVWTRVREESLRLAKKGHEVRVFSSNFVKGSDETAPPEETIGKVKIYRFPAKKLGGESFLKWNFLKEALDFKPDVIIAHNYRQIPTHISLKIKRKLNCKVFLVTHAPFVERDITRSFIAKHVVKIYDKTFGPSTINKFDKILAISEWEIPILKNIGARAEKIIYIPNGIPEEFFKQKKSSKEKNKILFLGRISPIKNLEVLIESITFLRSKKVKLEIVGPSEKDYLEKLKKIVEDNKLQKSVIFSEPIFEQKEKIKKIDSANIFVLPSKREAMPQALIEAMARKKIVISSANQGSKEIIKNNYSGYLFESNGPESLAKIILKALKSKTKMGANARKSVEKFSWDKVIEQIDKTISS